MGTDRNDQRKETVTLEGKLRPPIDGTSLPTLVFSLSTQESRANAPAEVAAEYVRVWGPPGATAWHHMKIEETPGNGRQSIEASVVVPGAKRWLLGEARISRVGGRAPADSEFRNLLYMRIGAAAVAGGRIEAAMKRLILHLSGSLEPAFADVRDDQWASLEKQLRAAALAAGERAADLITVLDWGQANRIRDIRNDIIHAYWWDYAGVGITRGRVHRDGTSEIILVTPEQLDSDCDKLGRYAETLDSAMNDVWLNVYLPRIDEDGGAVP